MSHVYHLLPESESFSENNGGSIARWVANVVREDEGAIIVAPSSDVSYDFDPTRIRNIGGLVSNKHFLDKGGYVLPWTLRLLMLGQIIRPALKELSAGDTVWIHERPEFAAALEPMIHACGARLILQMHHSHLVQWPARITTAIYADCYIFNSRYLRDEAQLKLPYLGRTAVLANAAEQRLFFPSPEQNQAPAIPTVLFASRLVPDNGLHIFVEAMRQLAECGTAVQGVVVECPGFSCDSSSNYVLEMKANAPSNVRFEAGCSRPQLAEKFRNADIFCLPSSSHDPFPIAVLDAMASGVPVVAIRSGGIPEQLAAGGGMIVPRNDATAFADALKYLAENPEARSQLGAQGLASFRNNFTWQSIQTTYRTILAKQSLAPILHHNAVLAGSHA